MWVCVLLHMAVNVNVAAKPHSRNKKEVRHDKKRITAFKKSFYKENISRCSLFSNRPRDKRGMDSRLKRSISHTHVRAQHTHTHLDICLHVAVCLRSKNKQIWLIVVMPIQRMSFTTQRTFINHQPPVNIPFHQWPFNSLRFQKHVPPQSIRFHYRDERLFLNPLISTDSQHAVHDTLKCHEWCILLNDVCLSGISERFISADYPHWDTRQKHSFDVTALINS